MKEWIKYEDYGNDAKLESHASGDTTMCVIARLILNMAKATNGRVSAKEILEIVEKDYIPRIVVEMASDKTLYEEVIDPEKRR